MQQLLIKFLIIICSVVSAQTVAAIPLFFNGSHTPSSLVVDSAEQQTLSVDAFVINANESEVKHNTHIQLIELLQNQSSSQFESVFQQLSQLINSDCLISFDRCENAAYQHYYQQQNSVLSAFQAQQNSSFHSQKAYQAARQKIALIIS